MRDHLVSSLRGKNGGYKLARPAGDYTVGEVLRATEGQLAPASGMDEPERFRAEEPRCHEMWERLGGIINDYLDGIRISDLCVTSLVGNDYVI